MVVLAQDEARALRHNYIGTEHLLLGLIREEEGIAARVLESFTLSLEEVRAQVSRIVGHGDLLEAGGMIPFTPRAKRILELALREAVALGHKHIGTEHLLLSLLRVDDGVAARILAEYGAQPDRVRERVLSHLSGESLAPAETPVLSVYSHAEAADEGRWAWVYEWWPPMVLGAGLFGGGLFVGWLIWG